jgi:hypothetical protein
MSMGHLLHVHQKQHLLLIAIVIEIPYRRNSSKIQSENRKKEVKSTLLETSIRRFLLFWLGTGTSIKSGEVNLQTYGNITSVFVLHLCNISDIL